MLLKNILCISRKKGKNISILYNVIKKQQCNYWKDFSFILLPYLLTPIPPHHGIGHTA